MGPSQESKSKFAVNFQPTRQHVGPVVSVQLPSFLYNPRWLRLKLIHWLFLLTESTARESSHTEKEREKGVVWPCFVPLRLRGGVQQDGKQGDQS